MYDAIAQFFQTLAAVSTMGDARGFSELFLTQYPVFCGRRVYFVEGQEAKQDCFLTNRDRLDRLGLHGYRAEVAGVSLSPGPRLRVHVDLTLDFGPQQPAVTEARTYGLLRGPGARDFAIETLSFRAASRIEYADWHRRFRIAD